MRFNEAVTKQGDSLKQNILKYAGYQEDNWES